MHVAMKNQTTKGCMKPSLNKITAAEAALVADVLGAFIADLVEFPFNKQIDRRLAAKLGRIRGKLASARLG